MSHSLEVGFWIATFEPNVDVREGSCVSVVGQSYLLLVHGTRQLTQHFIATQEQMHCGGLGGCLIWDHRWESF